MAKLGKRRRRLGAATTVLVTCMWLGALSVNAAPTGFVEEVVGPTLNNPVNVEFAPDGRVFVLEKSGRIKTWPTFADFESSVGETLFTDLNHNVHDFWDRGALGLALHPSYPSQPYVYVLYTYDAVIGGSAPTYGNSCPNSTPPSNGTGGDGCIVSGRLSRLTADTTAGTMVGAELVLIEDWCQQFPSHSIGDLEFGPDGALYASAGDGAAFHFTDHGQLNNPCGDPPSPAGVALAPPTAEGGALRSQSPRGSGSTLDGTVIRVDPMTGEAFPGNPWFADPDPNRSRVVAYGLRNPFRFTIRPGTHQLFVGDVGAGGWEEVNHIPNPLGGVRNFGWPCYEGGLSSGNPVSLRQAGFDGQDLNLCETLYSAGPSAVSAPYWAYRHGQAMTPGNVCPTGGGGGGGSSIAGLAFYTGGGYPGSYNGALFGADYSRRCIWVMFPDEGGNPDPSTIQQFHQTSGNGPVNLTMGPDGNMYYAMFGSSGNIRRFRFVGTNNPPVAVIEASPDSGTAPLEVSFDATGSSDPDQDEIVLYAWDLDGDGQFDDSSDPTVVHTFGVGSHTVRLRVTDARGESGTAQIVISASNTAPVPVIDTPGFGTQWVVGQQISFSGHATDEQQGILPPGSLIWTLILHHCEGGHGCHQHQIQTFPGVASGSFNAPDHGYPSWLELRLTATDEHGLQVTETLELHPLTVDLTFTTAPITGLDLVVYGTTRTSPYTATFIVGSSVSVSALAPQDAEETWNWGFTEWSNLGGQSHTITAPANDTTYTASYHQQLKPGYGDSFGMVQTTTGRWFLYDPDTTDTTSFYFGIPGDTPLMGDWDCDGVDTPGAYRESAAYVYLRNSNSTGIGDLAYFFGIPGDIPVAGDFNGDGCDTVSIYRPSESKFYITNQLGSSDQGFVAEYSFYFGIPGDRPFTGDFNGDGQTDVGLHRVTTGLVYYRFTLDTGIADSTLYWGAPGDAIIAGRWAVSGVPGEDTLGLFRPASSTVYLRFENSQGFADFSIAYGSPQMRPVAGRFGVLPGNSEAP